MPRAAVGRTSAEMYPSDRGHPARGASAAQTRSRSSAPASKPPSSCGRPSSPEPCQTAHRRRGRMARPHRRLPDCLRGPGLGAHSPCCPHRPPPRDLPVNTGVSLHPETYAECHPLQAKTASGPVSITATAPQSVRRRDGVLDRVRVTVEERPLRFKLLGMMVPLPGGAVPACGRSVNGRPR